MGISKYNRTLEENDFDNPIRHALEESLDLANYLRWILDKKMYSLSEIMEVIRILNTNVSEHTVESLLNNLRAEKRQSVLEELKGEE